MLVDGDTLDENDNENFFLNLSNALNASIVDAEGLGTITDDDSLPSVAIGDVTVTEGDTGTVTASFNVTLAPASGREVSVQYATADGTATAPADYSAAGGGLTFAAGETTKQVTVPVHSDALDEIDEDFTVDLSSALNATIADAEGVGTITDDDPQPSLSVNDVTVNEHEDATFTVTLSTASGRTVTVDYATADGTATWEQHTLEQTDYGQASGTLTFLAGQTSKTVVVDVHDGDHHELDETFFLNLTNASGASITDAEGVATIIDNDPAPEVEIDDVVLNEADGELSFTLNKSNQTGAPATVDYTTTDGSATSPADFGAVSGTVAFGGPDAVAHVAVQIADDALDEIDETFTITLSNAEGLTIVDGTGIGTITDDDPLPQASINDVTVTEGDAGSVNASFTVSLNAPSGRPVSIDYATANGTATAPSDYQTTAGTVSFPAGQTAQQVTVQVNADVLDEDDETFTVNLSGAVDATIADAEGLGTITDNDPLPALSVNDVTVTEGNSGTTNAVFTVTQSVVSGRPVTVDYATADSSAIAPGDYAATTGQLTFAPGQTTRTITVPVNGDLADEGTETYFLNLSNAGSATIVDNQGGGTIIDDDGEPTLSVNDVTVLESNTGTVTATFTVSLTPASGQTVSVGYSTQDGSATSPADYTGTGGSLVFTPGQTTRTFTVQVNGDLLDEIDESFTVHLSSPVNATIADDSGLGTITDNDAMPSLAIDNVTVPVEGNSGTVNATFTVTLNAPSGRAVSVDYATADSSATEPADYTATAGTLEFAAGRDDEDDHDRGQRRPARRDQRAVRRQPHHSVERDLRRLGRRRDDHRRRPAPGALDRRRDGHRGRCRHRRRDLHRHAHARQRPPGDRPVRDRRRQRDGRRGLRGNRLDDADLRSPARRRRRSPSRSTATCSTRSTRPSRSTSRAHSSRRSPIRSASGTITDDDALPQLAVDDVTVTEGDSGTSTRASRSPSPRSAAGR